MATPKVTAGFKCAPGLPHAIAVNTPHITANAHPAVITIQPEFSALDFFSNTPATTPSPNRISTVVPMNSPNQGASMRVPPSSHDHYFPQIHAKRKSFVRARKRPEHPLRPYFIVSLNCLAAEFSSRVSCTRMTLRFRGMAWVRLWRLSQVRMRCVSVRLARVKCTLYLLVLVRVNRIWLVVCRGGVPVRVRIGVGSGAWRTICLHAAIGGMRRNYCWCMERARP